jgi:hypothetical protein
MKNSPGKKLMKDEFEVDFYLYARNSFRGFVAPSGMM